MPNLIKLLGLSHTGHLTDTGEIPQNELRRKFNLGSNRLSSLSPSRDPFFTIVSKMRKDNTDDSEFKRLEERETWHRRYFYVMGGGDIASVAGTTGFSKAVWDGFVEKDAANGISALEVTTDYDVKGRFTHQSLQGNNDIFDKLAGKPHFLFNNQIIRIPVSALTDSNVVVWSDTMIVKIVSNPVDVSGEDGRVKFDAIIIKKPSTAIPANGVVVVGGAKTGADATTSTSGDVLIPMRDMQTPVTAQTKRREDRCQVVGSSYTEASGLPNTTYENKLSDTFGYTQIFKTDLSISNTAYATMLKYRPNEYKDRWRKTLLQHKRDITLAGFWSVLSKMDEDGKLKRTTQGMIDFILNNGFVFTLDADKDYDGFLEDLSEFYHPEIAQENGHLFHVDTATFNWFNRLNSGFMHNTFNGKSYYSVNLQFMGMKKFQGFHIMEFSTPHGTLRMTKDVNLDGTGIRIVGVDYNNVFYRPLVGNSLNRDTTIYMKVKDIAHTGDDYRTDLVQSEVGYDFRHGETFAIWK